MAPSPHKTSPIRAGLTCRCPRCGIGALFKARWTLDLETTCANCDLDYTFIDTGDGPAVFVIMVMGILILGAALTFEFTVHPPMWLHAVLWIPTTLFLAFGMLRPLKATLVALQYRNRAEEGRLAKD